MPSRVIREGWIESERIDQLDASAERFFLRLCLRADDFGRYHANPVLLKSNLFPLREDVRSTDSPRWLAACEKAGLVRCYEVSGKRYLEIVDFKQRMRAPVSKFPNPPDNAGQMPVKCQTSDSNPPPEAEAESEGESETDNESEKNAPRPLPALLNVPEFIEPWQQWQAIRRKSRKPKTSWEEYFAGQLAWLEKFGLQVAIDTVAYSARNQYAGLFEQRAGNGGGNRERKASFA